MSAYDIAASVLLVAGSVFFLVTAAAMLRVRDAVSRVNTLSPATGLGLPLLLVGAFVHDIGLHGWSTYTFVKVLLACAASIVVASVGSNVMARAVYRAQDTFDPETRSNALGPIRDRDPESDRPSPRPPWRDSKRG